MKTLMSQHVLMVDDDPAVCNVVREYLELNDLRVTTVNSGKQMFEALSRDVIDLLLLDLWLTGEDGMDLARMVRATSKMPIVLTGHVEQADGIIGPERCADAYVTKPFSRRELLTRIRAVLLRSQMEVVRSEPDETLRAYHFAGWELNVRLRRLQSPQGKRVEISRSEFNLLSAFLSAPQRVLTRNQLLDMSRLHSTEISDRAIKLQIMRLRRRLEPDPTNPTFIRTEWGAGYYFDVPVQVIR